MFSISKFMLIRMLGNSSTVNYIQNRYLLSGNFSTPSYSFAENELINYIQ